jgi:hypothetical protein
MEQVTFVITMVVIPIAARHLGFSSSITVCFSSPRSRAFPPPPCSSHTSRPPPMSARASPRHLPLPTYSWVSRGYQEALVDAPPSTTQGTDTYSTSLSSSERSRLTMAVMRTTTKVYVHSRTMLDPAHIGRVELLCSGHIVLPTHALIHLVSRSTRASGHQEGHLRWHVCLSCTSQARITWNEPT